MLSVKTNKNVMNIKQSFLGGYDLKESISIILGVILGTIIIVCLVLFSPVPTILCPYIAAPVIVLPIIHQFYNKDGMGFLAHKKKEHMYKNATALIYKSTENAEYYNKCLELDISKEDSTDDEFMKALKKVIIIGVVCGVLIIGLIICILVLKLK